MLDGEAEPARSGGADHEPIVVAGEVGVTQRLGEGAVVDLVVVPADALLRHAGGAAGLEDAEGAAGVGLAPGAPDFGLEVPQVLVLEVGEPGVEVVEGLDRLGGVPVLLAGPVQPERAAGLGVEVPLHDFAHVGVERFLGLLDLCFHEGGAGWARVRI